MSDSVTTPRRVSQGFAEVAELPPIGMISLRGDLSDPAMVKAVKDATGLGIPAVQAIVSAADRSVGWMSPDELLVLLPYGDVASTITSLSDTLNTKHFLAAGVSDSRAVFRIRGTGARDVLAKLTPTDLSPAAFHSGMLRRTRVAQVAAAFWISGPDEFTLISFRSVSDYVFGLLERSATPGGEVGLYS